MSGTSSRPDSDSGADRSPHLPIREVDHRSDADARGEPDGQDARPDERASLDPPPVIRRLIDRWLDRRFAEQDRKMEELARELRDEVNGRDHGSL